MNTLLPLDQKPGLHGLVDAILRSQAKDCLQLALSTAQWDSIASYFYFVPLVQGDVLFKQGSVDRTLYFVAEGNLSVHFEDPDSRIRMAIVGAGSVVGEGSFFTGLPRTATVQAGTRCTLWSLSPMKFTELTHRLPEMALAISMAAGAVVAKRLMHSRQRTAVT